MQQLGKTVKKPSHWHNMISYVHVQYDKDACGTVEYMTLMRDVLDDDMFAQYRH